MSTAEEAREKLEIVIPHLRSAMSMAKADGKPMIGILAVKPDGGGRIVVQFEGEEFVDDLCRALGLPIENTLDEELGARATRLAQQVERGTVDLDSPMPPLPTERTGKAERDQGHE